MSAEIHGMCRLNWPISNLQFQKRAFHRRPLRSHCQLNRHLIARLKMKYKQSLSRDGKIRRYWSGTTGPQKGIELAGCQFSGPQVLKHFGLRLSYFLPTIMEVVIPMTMLFHFIDFDSRRVPFDCRYAEQNPLMHWAYQLELALLLTTS